MITTTTRTTTRAAVINTFGGPEVLTVAEVPLASPTATQVQVQVAAAAVNPVDITTATSRWTVRSSRWCSVGTSPAPS